MLNSCIIPSRKCSHDIAGYILVSLLLFYNIMLYVHPVGGGMYIYAHIYVKSLVTVCYT